MRRTISILVAGMILGATSHEVSPLAQSSDCSADQRLGSATRLTEAIRRVRSVNTRQAQQKATISHYVTADELGLKDDNGFEVSLRTEASGYMVFIRDATDPCSSGVFSDHRGIIYTAKPIR
jgi:hypothetical protein